MQSRGSRADHDRNSGQACTAANHFLVQDGIYDALVAFAARIAAPKVGPGFDAGVTIGPLIDDRAVAKIDTLVNDAVSRGGRIVSGGGPHGLAARSTSPP